MVSACKRKWTEKDRSEFLSGCLSGATRDMDAVRARTYCHCMLEKLIKRYPDARQARYVRYDTAVVRLSKECLKQP